MRQALTSILALLLIVVIGGFFALNACGLKPFITRSGSMEPAIHTGSVCFVDTKASFGSMEEGDIIAFQTSTGEAVTHRAITVTEQAIETKGDANDVTDGFTTTRENFIGETLFSIPYLGYAIGYLQQPVGKIMVGVVILAIIAFAVIDGIDDRAKKKKEDEGSTEGTETNA